MLIVALIALVWLTLSVAAVAFCVYARDRDAEIAQEERAAAINEFTSIA